MYCTGAALIRTTRMIAHDAPKLCALPARGFELVLIKASASRLVSVWDRGFRSEKEKKKHSRQTLVRGGGSRHLFCFEKDDVFPPSAGG